MRTFALSILAAAIVAATAAEAAPLRGGDTVAAPVGAFNAPAGKTASGAVLPASQIGDTLAPLSAQECTKLGGKVITNTVCNSGSSCERVDQNHNVHEVCLSAK